VSLQVDLDRLADYVGGALDGTSDEAEVRHLVETDPEWTDAYEALLLADGLVSADLGRLGQEAPPMPADVVARLDAALSGAQRPRASAPSVDELAERRKRRRRWATALSAAAAVVVIGVGGGYIVTSHGDQMTSDSSGSAVNNGAAAPQAASEGQGPPPQRFSAKQDYNPSNLSQLGDLIQPKYSGNKDSQSAEGGPASPLSALTAPEALNACVAAVVQQHGGRAVAVVDATFQASPALIVILEGAPEADGRRLAVVVGPACGSTPSTIDQRFQGII
jgi:hypothetical protein